MKRRVSELQTRIAALPIPGVQKEKIRADEPCIGTPTEMAELAHGRPKLAHRRATAAGTSEVRFAPTKRSRL